MQKAQVYCLAINHGGLDFYLQQDGESYYLFNQRYRSDLHNWFKNGVALSQALRSVKRGIPTTVANVAEKLPAYIRYIEKEYDITVLEQTRRKKPSYS